MFDFKGKKKAYSGGAPTPPAGGGDGPSGHSGDAGLRTPEAALEALKAGNRAFVTGAGALSGVTARDLALVQDGQSPFATIVACADSRTPPSVVFNQGVGRLFTIRVAGNTVDRAGLASVVYAVEHLKCPLVVVMGHTGCGAVGLAQAVAEGRSELPASLEAMVTPILPAVLHAKAHPPHGDLAVACVEENARRVAKGLETADAALADAVRSGHVKIVGAAYDMKTGEVRFLG